VSTFNRVLLPDPESPTIANEVPIMVLLMRAGKEGEGNRKPEGISKDTSFNTGRLWPG